MAKTYVPTIVTDVHKMAVFLARYGSALRAAIVAIDPDAGGAYDALKLAVDGFDALYQTLYPLGS